MMALIAHADNGLRQRLRLQLQLRPGQPAMQILSQSGPRRKANETGHETGQEAKMQLAAGSTWTGDCLPACPDRVDS